MLDVPGGLPTLNNVRQKGDLPMMYALNDVTPIGRFNSEDEAKAACPGVERLWFVRSAADVEQLTEPEMRLLRATLKVLASGQPVEDMRVAATELRDSDPELNHRQKDKGKAAKLLMEALEAHSFNQSVKRRVRHRMSAKKYIRSLFPTISTVVWATALNTDHAYSDSAIATAISDLKNPKYAGDEGVIVIERKKSDDGLVYYERVG